MQAVDELIKRALKRADVMLAVCSHRWFDIDAMTSAMSLFANKKHHFTWAPVRGDALISRARSRTASFFLRERTEDVLFFLDDDIMFTEADATKLIDDVVGGCDIVGGMYVQKGALDKTCVLKEGDSITFSKDAKPKEVLAVSAGFMAIHRRVFEKMSRTIPLVNAANTKYHTFFQPFNKQIDGQWTELSEDWAFCDRASALGFKIWIDPSLLIGHKGEYVYDLRDKLRPPKISWDDFKPLTLGE